MTLEKLLENWDSPATADYVLCRGIVPWKWRCYALAAGVVDGRKWSGAEIARDRGVSRARICAVTKDVMRKLTDVLGPNPRREFFCRMRRCDLSNAVSVRKAFGLDGGRKPEFNGSCYPDVVNSVFIADGAEWVCDEVMGWKSAEHRRIFGLRCSRAGAGNSRRRNLEAPPAFNVHPLVVDCGGRRFVLAGFESAARTDRIILKSLE